MSKLFQHYNNFDINDKYKDIVGKRFKINIPEKVQCCSRILSEGSIVTVFIRNSKNKIGIKELNGWCHKIKISTLNRISEQID